MANSRAIERHRGREISRSLSNWSGHVREA